MLIASCIYSCESYLTGIKTSLWRQCQSFRNIILHRTDIGVPLHIIRLASWQVSEKTFTSKYCELSVTEFVYFILFYFIFFTLLFALILNQIPPCPVLFLFDEQHWFCALKKVAIYLRVKCLIYVTDALPSAQWAYFVHLLTPFDGCLIKLELSWLPFREISLISIVHFKHSLFRLVRDLFVRHFGSDRVPPMLVAGIYFLHSALRLQI